MYKVPLVALSFMAPTNFKGDRFRVEPLSYFNMIQDYAAVGKGAANMATYLRQRSSNYQCYPVQTEVIEVGWHMAEWRRRHSFAYAIMSPDRSACLGGIYVNPTKKNDYDALVLMWMVPDVADGLEREVFESVKTWIAEKWPFDKVGFPGRDISWEDWDKVAEQPGPRLVDTADARA